MAQVNGHSGLEYLIEALDRVVNLTSFLKPTHSGQNGMMPEIIPPEIIEGNRKNISSKKHEKNKHPTT